MRKFNLTIRYLILLVLCAITLNVQAQTDNGHEYVDLGLPSGTLWATCNVGANSPEEKGGYFAWGETQAKTTFSWSNYKYCNGSSNTMTKYCTDSSYGTVDNKTTLESQDDAAYVNWGSNWRMPTQAEEGELRNKNYCSWTWTTQNNAEGYRVTSKINGNSIFIPSTGYMTGSNIHFSVDGKLWTSNINISEPNCAYRLGFNRSGVDIDSVTTYRYYGFTIRPVYNREKTPSSTTYTVSVSATEGGIAEASATEVEEGATVTLTATPNAGYVFVNWTVNCKVVSTENPYTATITAESEFVANFGTPLSEPTGTENGYGYVDLGLPSGTKWATCNVGATTPEEYGDYFAWGETEPKDYYD